MNDLVQFRADIVRLESEALKWPQLDLPVNHYFARGVYVRELPIPAGAMIVGRVHKYSQVSMLIKGEMTIFSGGELKKMRAPCIIECPPGIKRAGYAHEDSIFVSVHGTYETDPDKALDELTTVSYEEFDRFCLEQKTKELT
jgi:hypothetical protein